MSDKRPVVHDLNERPAKGTTFIVIRKSPTDGIVAHEDEYWGKWEWEDSLAWTTEQDAAAILLAHQRGELVYVGADEVVIPKEYLRYCREDSEGL